MYARLSQRPRNDHITRSMDEHICPTVYPRAHHRTPWQTSNELRWQLDIMCEGGVLVNVAIVEAL